MLSVSIFVNGNPIYTRTAVNVGFAKGKTKKHKYKIDDKSVIEHDPDDGAVKLAIAMLRTIHEVK